MYHVSLSELSEKQRIGEAVPFHGETAKVSRIMSIYLS